MKSFTIQKIKEASFMLCLFAFIAFACQPNTTSIEQDSESAYRQQFTKHYLADLDRAMASVEAMQQTNNSDSLRKLFRPARLAFKRIEPVLAFFNEAAYYSLNQPNLPKVEEDGNSNKVITPLGFQVVEEVLFQEEVDEKELHRQINNIHTTLRLERENYSIKFLKKHQVLWLLRESLLRVMALGISGFDSPIIEHSLPEAAAVFASLQQYIQLSSTCFNDPNLVKLWQQELSAAQQTLAKADDFNAFDRYHFIKNHLHPLLGLWAKTPDSWQVEFPFPQKINHKATSFFAAETFVVNQFAPNYAVAVTDEVIALGKNLFHDQQLSGNKKMSCATCHQVELAFTDGKKLAIGHQGDDLQRNSPSLYYAGLQAAQFYDARVGNLENQILQVVHNEEEFQGNIDSLVIYVQKSASYTQAFTTSYKGEITSKTVRNAIAAYVRSLAPFNSKFDRNISGVEKSLSADEITGFNLFMGKAKCGTCHFAPIFNGTVPPKFSESELEVLGVPNELKWENASLDDDLGRYLIFGAELKRGAFKTPTVRNSAKTAPYMHNGVYQTLEQVIDFYNRGGGVGIGITLENQTLPPDSLNLSQKEIIQLISFLNTLTDEQESPYLDQ